MHFCFVPMNFDGLPLKPDVKEYLERSEIRRVVPEILNLLLNKRKLPYNPYPELIKRLRAQSQLKNVSDEVVKNATNAPVVDTDAWLTCPTGFDDVWGLETVLQCVDPRHVRRFKTLVQHEERTAQEMTQRQTGFDCRVVAMLCGPSAFSGSLLIHSSIIEVKLEYLMWGPNQEKAMHIFACSVVADLVKLVHDREHIAVELHLPGHSIPNWSPNAIVHQNEDLIRAIIDITAKKQNPILECMFKHLKHSEIYHPGTKQYTFTFTRTSDEDSNNWFYSFTDLPMSALLSGIFFGKNEAFAYLSAFMPASVQRDETSPQNVLQSRAVSNRRSVAGTAATSTRRARPVRLPGDRDEKTDHLSPERAAEWLREDWKRQVARQDMPLGFIDVAHCILQWVCMDRERFSDVQATLGEICRLGRTDCARLDALLRYGSALERALAKAAKPEVLGRLWESLFHFRDQIVEFLNPGLHFVDKKHAVSSKWPIVGLENDQRSWYTFDSHVVAHDVIKTTLDNVLMNKLRTGANHHQEITNCLSYVTRYLKTLQWALLDDIAGHYTILEAIHREVIREYPSLRPLRATTPLKETPQVDAEKKGFFRRQKTERQLDVPTVEAPVYNHGSDVDILATRKMHLDVETAIRASTSPAAIGAESVLLQYCVDARLDETLQDFLTDFLTRGHLPANLYPKLVNRLQASMHRLELWGDSIHRLISRLRCPLLRQDAKGKGYHIHQVSDCSAYGHRSAVAFLDSQRFKSVEVAAREFACTTLRRIDRFKITVDLTVTGFTPFYGRLMPYLLKIELNEHYYIQGPGNKETSVLDIFAEIVLNHLREFIQKPRNVVMGLVLDQPKVTWTPEEIMDPSKQPHLKVELADVARRRESIVLECYTVMDWRYVSVQKQFCLHYLSETDSGDVDSDYIPFFPDNPASLYQNVFSLQDKAVNHYSVALGLDAGDPFSKVNSQSALTYIAWKLSECVARMDLVSTYRWLLLRALISEHSDFDQVADSWRMFHSVAGQLEYLHVLNKDIQRLLNQERNETKQQCPVDTVVLGRMIDGFRTKLSSVLAGTPTFSNHDILRLRLEDQIRPYIQKDPKTGAISVTANEKMVSALEAVSAALQPIAHTAAAEIHTLCKTTQEIVTSVETEAKTRRSAREASAL
ncbi:uncharacterized protein [Oscarella lobularis]|uniref:uncharacterized protein isoform X2 n=1 Tax=Oscarella lobularis TaxID=121494 RepID=UPI003313F5D3